MTAELVPISDFVAELAGSGARPASGAVAAVVAALAASLVERVADGSRAQWPEAAGAVAQAQALNRRARSLAQRGAAAYGEARAALDAVGQGEDTSALRNWQLGKTVAAAAGPPLALAACAADIAQLAAGAAVSGDGALVADAVVAAKLAAAAADSAAHLVAINLVAGSDAERLALARQRATAAAEAARSAVTT
jgi:formiminotetrahydrofolate cyclodeaminase